MLARVSAHCCGSLPALAAPQPKQINEIKDFLLTARRKDAKCELLGRLLGCCVG